MRMPAGKFGLALTLVGAFLFASCGGGGSGGGSESTSSGEGSSNSSLVLIDTSVSGLVGVSLNQIIVFEFSDDLDPDTVRPDTIRIRQGPDYGKQVPGDFRVDGNIVRFYPRLPVMADLSDAGLQPGRPYRITLPGSPAVATVRSWTGEHIGSTVSLDFSTQEASAAGVFIDNFLDPLPPTVVSVNPPDNATGVPADSEIILTMNRRPLHPATVTDGNIRLWMETRQGVTQNRPMPIEPVLEQTHETVRIRINPSFPLADEATYRIEVNRRVQDLVGNDVVPPGNQSMFVSRFSVRDEPFRYASVSLTFDEVEKSKYMDEVNTTASWNESEPDALAALFTVAGGNGTAGDLRPTANIQLDPTDFKRGVEVMTDEKNVDYDVYNFRAIDIPDGVTVRFSQRPGGPNRPIALLALKNIVIAGTLTVSGGNGENGEGTVYSTSSIPLARGGAAGPGGGDGSNNDTGPECFSPPVMSAKDVPYGGGGGKGGEFGTYRYSYYSSSTYYYRYAYSYTSGGGGGGGSRTSGTAGEAGTYPSAGYYGEGGKGGLSAQMRGFGLNYERVPNVGGAGGGAGGKGFYDYYYYSAGYTSRSQYYGGAGAGGGGGGGIRVQGAGDVTIKGTGRILADGGTGGNAGQYYVYSGGAGGGGAGGSVKVVATGQVYLESGATISVTGGSGGIYNGTYTYYHAGLGGRGGVGYIRFEAIEDENTPGKALVNGVSGSKLTYAPPSTGTFAPMGGGAPSVGQTLWVNLGVYDPVMQKPNASDIVATLYNDSMSIDVQMAIEDPNNLGHPDLSGLDLFDQDKDGETDDSIDLNKVSDWVGFNSIQSLNTPMRHYQFIRLRVTFQLDDGQTADQPLPFLDLLRIRFGF